MSWAPRRVQEAVEAHRTRPTPSSPWATDLSKGSDRVGWTSNEGYYQQRSDGTVVKSLDWGHTLSDVREGLLISAQKGSTVAMSNR